MRCLHAQGVVLEFPQLFTSPAWVLGVWSVITGHHVPAMPRRVGWLRAELSCGAGVALLRGGWMLGRNNPSMLAALLPGPGLGSSRGRAEPGQCPGSQDELGHLAQPQQQGAEGGSWPLPSAGLCVLCIPRACVTVCDFICELLFPSEVFAEPVTFAGMCASQSCWRMAALPSPSQAASAGCFLPFLSLLGCFVVLRFPR